MANISVEERCRAIDHLTRIAYNAGLVIEIGIPADHFHGVAYSYGLEIVADRERLPCAWLNGVKLTPTHASPMMKG